MRRVSLVRMCAPWRAAVGMTQNAASWGSGRQVLPSPHSWGHPKGRWQLSLFLPEFPGIYLVQRDMGVRAPGNVAGRRQGQHGSHQVLPDQHHTDRARARSETHLQASGSLCAKVCPAGQGTPRFPGWTCGPQGIPWLCVNREVSGQARGEAQSGATWVGPGECEEVTVAAAEAQSEWHPWGVLGKAWQGVHVMSWILGPRGGWGAAPLQPGGLEGLPIACLYHLLRSNTASELMAIQRSQNWKR